MKAVLKSLTRIALAGILIIGGVGLTSCDKISSIIKGVKETENTSDSKLEKMFETVSTNKLTTSDLSGMSQGDMRLLRASIYARHGKIFKEADLTEYFSGYDWYKPERENVDELLNNVEISNIKYIDEYAGVPLGGSDMQSAGSLTPPDSQNVQSKRERNVSASESSGRSRFGHVGFTNDYSDIVCYQYLTDDDVCNLSGPELRILRNTIYARHGRRFKSADLREYFSGFSWYNPRVNEVNPKELSDVEKHNIQLIQRYE